MRRGCSTDEKASPPDSGLGFYTFCQKPRQLGKNKCVYVTVFDASRQGGRSEGVAVRAVECVCSPTPRTRKKNEPRGPARVRTAPLSLWLALERQKRARSARVCLIQFVTSGNRCIALRRWSVVRCVYCRDIAALSCPTICRASTSETPDAFSIVTALCRKL